MSAEVVDAALAAAVRGGCGIVNLSGGEPFLLGDGLEAIVRQIQKAGIDVRISTSAYWAHTLAIAVRRLEMLARAGVTQLFISHSDYHLAFVPTRNVVFAAKAAGDCGIKVAVILARHKHSAVGRSSVEREFAAHDVPLPLITISRVVPFGRAEDTLDDSLLVQPIEQIEGPCASMTEHPTVFEDGTLAGCAGVMNRETPLLQFGSIGAPEAVDGFERMRRSPLANWIHSFGVVALKELVEANSPLRFNGSYTNICHLCGDLLRNPEAGAVLADLGLCEPPQEQATSCTSE